MSSGVEVEYLDVLQNIESMIVQMDHEQEDLTDYEVGDVLDALIRAYRAEASGYRPPVLRLTPLKLELYERVRAVCEWRLGRASLTPIDESDDALSEPLEIASTNDAAPSDEIASVGEIPPSDELEIASSDEINEAGEVASMGVEEMVACLKRLRLSVKRWNSQGGRRGYLEFVSQFVPG